MGNVEQCPVCFGKLEVIRVNPCFVCGGWPEIEPSKPAHHFTLRDDGTQITLCNFCWLEEILADQGDLKGRIRISSENDLVAAPGGSIPEQDKFCPTCNRRLALLKVMAHRLSQEELEAWRK